MKKVPVFDAPQKRQPSQMERLKNMGVKAFATASAYGCGRNPVDMQRLQQTGRTSAFVSLNSCNDIRA